MCSSLHFYCIAFACYKSDFQRAFENLSIALSNEPLHAPSLSLMGTIYLNQFKDIKKAEAFFKKSINADPQYLYGHEVYIEFLLNKKDYPQLKIIIENTKQILGVSMHFILISNARAMESMTRYNEAIEYLEEAKSISQTKESDFEIEVHYNRIKSKMEKSSSRPQLKRAYFFSSKTI
jgi:tetratricopeptide (TPR) repeat protein